MRVFKLTQEQKDILVGKEYKKSSKFNPTEDANGNFILSQKEVSEVENPDYFWIKELPTIEHKPKIIDFTL